MSIGVSGTPVDVSPEASSERIDRFLAAGQRPIAMVAMVFGALRVLLFAAFFPLFNPVDEHQHYDTVYRYAHGQWPGKELPKISPQTAELSTLFSSFEYMNSRERLRKLHRDVPLAELSPQDKAKWYDKDLSSWRGLSNTEAQSPPVYYLVAGAWYRLGALGGLKDWQLGYWVRFLNAVLYGAFVWVSYLFVRQTFAERPLIVAGVPLLLAVTPQDVFYGVNRDVVSPLLAAAVLLCLFRGLRADRSQWALLLGAGLLVSAAFLSDLSNIVLYGALGAVLMLVVRRAKSQERGRIWMAIALSGLAATVPPAIWLVRNRLVMGNWTGSSAKIALLGWTVKPLGEMLHHPIFTLGGFSDFATQVTRTSWRGELVWAGLPMRGEVADGFYVLSSFAMFAAFLAYLILEFRKLSTLEVAAGVTSVYLALASALFLAAVSLPFDFHDCYYPSKEEPFFTSGRIICGALLPLAIIYVGGLDFLWKPALRRYVHPIFVLLVVCGAVMVSEVLLSRPVFSSAFNWFALRKL